MPYVPIDAYKFPLDWGGVKAPQGTPSRVASCQVETRGLKQVLELLSRPFLPPQLHRSFDIAVVAEEVSAVLCALTVEWDASAQFSH